MDYARFCNLDLYFHEEAHWGEEGVAGFVYVTFSADNNEMTPLKYDGAAYLSETYERQ